MIKYNIGLDGYFIRQMCNQSPTQMTGYLIGCPDGSTVCIDGGTYAETPKMREWIRERGNTVHLWLLTHCHDDHVSPALEILENPEGIRVEAVSYLFPSTDWVGAPDIMDQLKRYEALNLSNRIPAEKGLCLTCGGLKIECLSDPLLIVREPKLDPPNFGVNDTSAVWRVEFPNGKVALFPGDVGPGVSERLVQELGDRLKADICQMSHHGQNGACRAFYEAVSPSLCFWDAPDWLWENDIGGGYDSGPWATLEVRRWMAELGTIRHLTIAEGEHVLY